MEQNVNDLGIENSSSIETPDEVQMLPVWNFMTGHDTLESCDQCAYILVTHGMHMHIS